MRATILPGPYISSLTKGKAIIDIMNTMPFDAVTIGNHEFDHGWDNTLLQLSQAKFPIVQGNVFYQNSSKSFWDKPYTIIEKDGVKIEDGKVIFHIKQMERNSRFRC